MPELERVAQARDAARTERDAMSEPRRMPARELGCVRVAAGQQLEEPAQANGYP
jgi:hypothetical protein